jgi:hypothetical protein
MCEANFCYSYEVHSNPSGQPVSDGFEWEAKCIVTRTAQIESGMRAAKSKDS